MPVERSEVLSMQNISRYTPTAIAPNGSQREDLYQMAAYLGRFQAPVGNETLGVLAYPCDPSRPFTPPAELNSPWSLDGCKKVGFVSLPHESGEAVTRLRHFLVQVTRTNPGLVKA